MVRAPCCEKMGLKKGPWTPEEDQILVSYVQLYGHANWRALPKHAGLLRCGKSCRLRWMNYLRPDIKRGNFTREEEDIIVHWHELLGNRWSAIAARLPGRTDNEIKNVWHTHLKKPALQAAQQPRKKKLRRTDHARAYDDVGACKPIPTLRVDPVAAGPTAAYNTRPYDIEEYYPSMVAAPSPISQSCSEVSSMAAGHPASNVTGETPAGSSVRNEEYNTNSSSELFLCMDDHFWSEAMALPLDGESVASLCLTAESSFAPCNNTSAAGGGSFRTDASSSGAPEHDVGFWLSVLTEVGGGGSPDWPISSF